MPMPLSRKDLQNTRFARDNQGLFLIVKPSCVRKLLIIDAKLLNSGKLFCPPERICDKNSALAIIWPASSTADCLSIVGRSAVTLVTDFWPKRLHRPGAKGLQCIRKRLQPIGARLRREGSATLFVLRVLELRFVTIGVQRDQFRAIQLPSRSKFSEPEKPQAFQIRSKTGFRI